MAPRKGKRRAPARRSGIRYLRANQHTRVIGVRGKPVKRIVPGRKYTIEVLHGKKVVGYVSKRDQKSKKLIAETVTRAQIQRFKLGKKLMTAAFSKGGKKFKINKRDYIKNQIPKAVLKEIKKNRGKLVHMRVEGIPIGPPLTTPQTYLSGPLSDEKLTNHLASQLIYQINRTKFRVSPSLTDIESGEMDELEESRYASRAEKQKKSDRRRGIKRVDELTVQVRYTELRTENMAKRKTKPKKRRLTKRERIRGR